MKKIFIASAVLCSVAVMATSLKNETKSASQSTFDMRVYQDTPPKNKKLPTDTSKVPWPDSTRKPTPPSN